MNQLLPQEVVDQIVREERHFSAAPQAFFEAWKRGVEIAGPQWFGDGTREGLNQAKSKWDLRPDMLRLNDALGVLSSGERMFLSAMVSFYNAREGGAMLKRCHFHGLSDFDGLDLQRRKVIPGTPSSLRSRDPMRDMRLARGHVPRVSPRPVPSGIRRFPCGCHRPQGLAPFIHRKEPSWPTITTKPPAFSCSTV